MQRQERLIAVRVNTHRQFILKKPGITDMEVALNDIRKTKNESAAGFGLAKELLRNALRAEESWDGETYIEGTEVCDEEGNVTSPGEPVFVLKQKISYSDVKSDSDLEYVLDDDWFALIGIFQELIGGGDSGKVSVKSIRRSSV